MKRLVVLVVVLYCCSFSIGRTYAQENAQEEVQVKEQPKPKVEEKGDQDLLNRIEELEKRINELTEESRARRKLEITEQEKQQKEKDVLEAVGREYTMDPKHSLGLDYTLTYRYTPSETILDQALVRHDANHEVRHIITTSYSALDNLSLSSSIPFVYRYDQVGTDSQIDETDIGDISAGFSFQPRASKAGDVSSTVNFSASLPTGRSPYKIVAGKELSTGSGIYSFSLGGSFSKQIDPVVAFWSTSFGYSLPASGLDYKISDTQILEKYDPGSSFSLAGGLAYALSYKISVNSSISYSYQKSSRIYIQGVSRAVKSGDNAGATLSFGMGWKATDKTTLSFNVGYGLTGTGFSFTFRVPYTFVL